MRALLRSRLGAASSDRGVALAMVIGIGSVLLLLVTLTMTFSVSGIVRADHDKDWDAAMSAAYAGIAEYQGRLTNDPSYQQYGNPASKFTIANGSAGTVALPSGNNNPAFDVAAGARWAAVPLSDGLPANAAFRYEVDNSKYASTGVLHVRATGLVDTVARSVVANIKQTGFTNYVYFTDYEILDPQLNSKSCTKAYAWQSTTARTSGCLINFITGDTLDGAVHSNDTLNICGGTFKQRVSTANPNRDSSGKLYSSNNCPSGSTTPVFNAGAPGNAALITMPPPQQQLDQVRTDIQGKVPKPGCLYTGPTKITFKLVGGVAKMNVISPWTKQTQVVGNPATGPGVPANPAFCGKPGDPTKTSNTGTLSDTVNGQDITIDSTSQLYNNLIYVQSIPTATSDPNSWASNKSPNGNTFKCVGADKTSSGNGLDYPLKYEVVATAAAYSCTAGDVFVQGTMHSAITINADHFAWITGKLVYSDAAHDILGLVGAGAVWVYNPLVCTSPSNWTSGSCNAASSPITWEASSSSTSCARTINAAILSNYHSFEVQNYDSGDPYGYLCVTGSIAQEFRGPVGQGSGSSGFLKRYSYDTRLLNSPPPKFPTPRTTSYDVTTEIEVAVAYRSNGGPTS